MVLKMRDWGWKIFFVLFILAILIPGRIEIDFVVSLYRTNPRLCLLLAACAMAGIGVAWWLRVTRTPEEKVRGENPSPTRHHN